MNTAVKDVADKLHSAAGSLGLLGIPTTEQLTVDWGVYYNAIPDSPDKCVTLLENTPPPPFTALDKSEPLQEIPIQLRCRSNDALDAHAMADKLMRFLYTLSSFDVVNGNESVNYQQFLHGGGPLSLGWDGRRRFTYAVNMRVMRLRTVTQGE